MAVAPASPSPQFFKGNGGYVGKTVAGNDTTVNVKEWAMERSARMADATHSGTAGWALYKATVYEASGTFKADWDAAAPQDTTVGMDIGAEVVGVFKLGASAKAYRGNIVIEKLSFQVNNQSGLVSYDCAWKGQGPMTLGNA